MCILHLGLCVVYHKITTAAVFVNISKNKTHYRHMQELCSSNITAPPLGWAYVLQHCAWSDSSPSEDRTIRVNPLCEWKSKLMAFLPRSHFKNESISNVKGPLHYAYFRYSQYSVCVCIGGKGDWGGGLFSVRVSCIDFLSFALTWPSLDTSV